MYISLYHIIGLYLCPNMFKSTTNYRTCFWWFCLVLDMLEGKELKMMRYNMNFCRLQCACFNLFYICRYFSFGQHICRYFKWRKDKQFQIHFFFWSNFQIHLRGIHQGLAHFHTFGPISHIWANRFCVWWAGWVTRLSGGPILD